ncbi:MAG: T9SS type A sorting domain-containing protein, partial [candidate division WOR-3 bacterium]
TYYDGDQVTANDVLPDSFSVSIGNPDIGVLAIVAPTGRVDTGAVVVPKGRVKNWGDVSVPFRAWFVMNDPTDGERYREYIDVTGLAVGAETTLTFPLFNVGTVEGNWTSRCSVAAPGDVQPNNDFRNGTFLVSSRPPWPVGWSEVTPMPTGSKAVKDGAWLTIAGEGGLVYAAKGNKSPDFFSFNASDSSWVTLTAIPNGSEAKPPYRGAVGVCDGSGSVYATKGNNTLGFWRYDIGARTWTQLPDVPLGSNSQRIKGGTDMVYVVENDTGYVYLLKGYKTDFFRFNTVTGAWDTSLPSAPAGSNPKWDKGSWLVYDGQNALYAHKAKYHELWVFNISSHSWASSALSGMPLVGMMGKSKKSKDGGCAAYYDGAIYALKGGNTQEFWRYTIGSGSWQELDTMPSFGSTGKKKRVKAGADIVSYGGGVFFALKGNKTLEFWRYTQPLGLVISGGAGRSGISAARAASGRSADLVLPNPVFRRRLRLYGSFAQRGQVTARFFDAAGRQVLVEQLDFSGTGTAELDVARLAAGVYLFRLDGQGFSTMRKLIVK